MCQQLAWQLTQLAYWPIVIEKIYISILICLLKGVYAGPSGRIWKGGGVAGNVPTRPNCKLFPCQFAAAPVLQDFHPGERGGGGGAWPSAPRFLWPGYVSIQSSKLFDRVKQLYMN